MKKWILTTLFLLLSLNAVQADDGSSSLISGGASVAVTPHPSVRMVREEVQVQLYPDKALVHCQFIFKNDGKACSVKMGFPEEKQASGDTGKLFRMWGFKSWVDGTLVQTRRVQMVRGHQNAFNSYQALYLKEVSFKSGQVRTVVDEYTTELGDMGWIFSPYCEYRLFTYVLKTGATWKGSIGEAEIKVDYSHLPFLYHVKPELAGSVRRGKSLIWILKNIEPKEDVSIILEKRGPKLNGKTIPGDSWSPYIVREGVLRSVQALFMSCAELLNISKMVCVSFNMELIL
jgi:hypothetical protein